MENLLITVICLSLCSCASMRPENQIIGKWEWIGSAGGFAGNLITPESEGRSMSVVFGEDNIYRYYENGEQKYSVKYEIPRQPKNEFGLLVNIKEWAYSCRLENNILVLNPLMSDGYIHIFYRSGTKKPDSTFEELFFNYLKETDEIYKRLNSNKASGAN